MSKQNETIADIVRKIRKEADALKVDETCQDFDLIHVEWNHRRRDRLRALANRIEAAHKREVVVSKTETTTQGNAAKMRKALEYAHDTWVKMYEYIEPLAQPHLLQVLADAGRMMETALSAPPRNCDRFRTVDDASDEYERLVEEGKAEDGTWGEWLFSTGQYATNGGAK